ncbi:hypothetical protein SEVIR_4G042300v4 [Setaria viridis]|uniref:Ionotropic glutamate receptor C-terminal domain-containing protein n=1 Tax=Setaria viridis TaxID=4556 RepID=A0A4U6UT55_SETVI|nr:glutamate receptor 2.8-like isoform X1 [Setaria viridis]TKW19781.1 hypothetical protein SEVIR_4G042300v2 [Setaria viridis]
MERRSGLLVAALLFLLTFWSVRGSAAAATTTTVPIVGGRKSLASISMALDGSYMKHPSHATRAGLHVTDSRGDPVASAHADTKRIDDRGLVSRYPSAAPRGNEKLIIAVPVKHGFQIFLDFAIDIFKTAMSKLQHPPRYELHAFNGTYDELVRNVSIGMFHGAAGDVTITADRARDADFTMPYAQSGVSLLVLADNDSKPPIQWIFLDPLTTELWLTTVVFFFLTAFVVWMIERPSNPVYQGSTVRQFSTASYFAFSTLTFSHGQIIRSPLSKVVVVIWCFAVLVLVQSYTANLSSILTAKRLRPSVTGLDQLVRNGDYIGYQDGAFVRSFLIKQGAKEKKLKPYNNQAEYAEALRKGSKNGGVSAIVDEIPYLTYFLSDGNNKEFEMGEPLCKTPGLGFVFPKGTPLVHELSIAILDLTGGNESLQIERKWFHSAAPFMGDDSQNVNYKPLTLRSFSGLFVITAGVSASMLFISVILSVYASWYSRVTSSESQSTNGNDGSVRLNGIVPDQLLHEGRDGDSQGAQHGGSGDEEAGGPMQGSALHNGTGNGSVPQVSIQVEMSSSQGVGRAL